MKNLTVAIFLALFFCLVSGYSEDPAEGFKENPEYAVPDSKKTEEPVQPAQKEPSANPDKKPDVRDRSSSDRYHKPNPGTAYQRRSSASTQFGGERYGGDRELPEWERRNKPVPTSLPRASNFRSRSSSWSSSFRNNRIYYRSGSCRSSSRTITVNSCCDR